MWLHSWIKNKTKQNSSWPWIPLGEMQIPNLEDSHNRILCPLDIIFCCSLSCKPLPHIHLKGSMLFCCHVLLSLQRPTEPDAGPTHDTFLFLHFGPYYPFFLAWLFTTLHPAKSSSRKLFLIPPQYHVPFLCTNFDCSIYCIILTAGTSLKLQTQDARSMYFNFFLQLSLSSITLVLGEVPHKHTEMRICVQTIY